ncbi:hypothetical protein E2C01_006357 [Portunus trituberculatus]|uniref:Uncharacterized protein n=1 Tax=Portunus trituberculatus TaxID=210409 RepID=A0A5B7CUV8_PORTR|nr:hypothetical protein [Portunus trituberculatus]
MFSFACALYFPFPTLSTRHALLPSLFPAAGAAAPGGDAFMAQRSTHRLETPRCSGRQRFPELDFTVRVWYRGLLVNPAAGPDNFVSIDGRKTYFDLFPAATQLQRLGLMPRCELNKGGFTRVNMRLELPAV